MSSTTRRPRPSALAQAAAKAGVIIAGAGRGGEASPAKELERDMEAWFRENFVPQVPQPQGEAWGADAWGEITVEEEPAPQPAKAWLAAEFGKVIPGFIIDSIAARFDQEAPHWGLAPPPPDPLAEVLRRLDAAEAALAALRPAHGGLGHNNPPDGPLDAEEHQAAEGAVAELRAEAQSPTPDATRVRRIGVKIGKAATTIAAWIARHADTATGEAAKAAGKSLG
ncbi:hypothetical protein ACLF3G_27465, partial [Falsiroseomonas sp. HC035]|uniref:hypothetical protein n=1 Tax=Falsiroseomonas sp. HC035 TaxID=3390999 RepID=UPI003D314A67